MKTSKKAVKRDEKGVFPRSLSLDLISYLPVAIVLDVFCQRHRLTFAAAYSLLIIHYCGSVTLKLLADLQYVKGSSTSYAGVKQRVSILIEKGMIVKSGVEYSLSSKCVAAMREVLVEGERAKILADIDKRITRSEAYRKRKAGLK